METIKKQLVLLEIIGLKSKYEIGQDEIDLKMFWNLIVRERYKLQEEQYTQIEIANLMSSSNFHGCDLPLFIKKLDAIYDGKYFFDSYKNHGFIGTFKQYLIGYTVYVLRTRFNTGSIDAKINVELGKPYTLEKLGLEIPQVVYATWLWDYSLQSQYPLDSNEELDNWLAIFNNYVKPEINGYSHPEWFCKQYGIEFKPLEVDKIIVKDDINDKQILEINGRLFSSALSIDGVNLVGWVKTPIGIGEDIRVACDSFSTIDIPYCIVDAAKILSPAPKQEETIYDQYIVDDFQYGTNIIFLDAATNFRYYGHFALKDQISSQKTILVAPWELPEWSSEVAFVLEHVDVFWAATHYIYESFKPYFRDKFIQLAPPAVVVPENELDNFEIKNVQGTFKFLTTFDGLSSIHRKNPFAVIQAFQLAFPEEINENVKLIVKTMNFSSDNLELKDLAEQIASDDRIQIVNEALSKKELNALIRTTHCFVSLHRAEGFGRNIAEMMLFNRPVIVSRFSGNLDFCFEDNSYLVDGNMILVGEHYWYSKDQKWFDASVEHAAKQMRNVFKDRATASLKAKKAKEYMSTFHSVRETGQRYKKLLESYEKNSHSCA